MSAQLKPSDKIKQVDPVWDAVRANAKGIVADEPALAAMVMAHVLNQHARAREHFHEPGHDAAAAVSALPGHGLWLAPIGNQPTTASSPGAAAIPAKDCCSCMQLSALGRLASSGIKGSSPSSTFEDQRRLP